MSTNAEDVEQLIKWKGSNACEVRMKILKDLEESE
jgi:hypothetical protein